jgi:hypothetical protein
MRMQFFNSPVELLRFDIGAGEIISASQRLVSLL